MFYVLAFRRRGAEQWVRSSNVVLASISRRAKILADANYIWLSEWQLENINQNFLLPIDLETYRKLKNHIAKALAPLIQIWLYASQKKDRSKSATTSCARCLAFRCTRSRHSSLVS